MIEACDMGLAKAMGFEESTQGACIRKGVHNVWVLIARNSIFVTHVVEFCLVRRDGGYQVLELGEFGIG